MPGFNGWFCVPLNVLKLPILGFFFFVNSSQRILVCNWTKRDTLNSGLDFVFVEKNGKNSSQSKPKQKIFRYWIVSHKAWMQFKYVPCLADLLGPVSQFFVVPGLVGHCTELEHFEFTIALPAEIHSALEWFFH